VAEFDDIRPFRDDEVAGVLQRMLADEDFIGFISSYRAPVLSRIFTRLVKQRIRSVLSRETRHIDSIDKFQHIVSDYVTSLIKDSTTSFEHQGVDRLEKQKGYLFISNHRYIAADSMLVDYALYSLGYDTVRIAIGDNLLQRPFATDLMRLNKSFIIKRSAEGPKNIYAALLQTSRYVVHSLNEAQSVWIAQSEGRAKDGMDNTDPALIKMLTLSQRKFSGSYTELIESLNIVPVSIAYEYDPCDLLKAKELYDIETHGSYIKPSGEDLLSLVKGLNEFKGRVKLCLGKPLRGDFLTPDDVATELDRQILGNYELYPPNYIALSLIDEKPYRDLWRTHEQEYLKNFTGQELKSFTERLGECPAEHQPYFLRMYANPLNNLPGNR
jgi:1-acyl-sn-glycerol-3-phosphate acyltransferase